MTDERKIDWILFDGECRLCTGAVRRFQRLLRRYRFGFAPLQAAWVKERLAVPDVELLSEMRLLTRRGEVFGGADAVVAIGRRIWWLWPAALVAGLPLIRVGLRKVYRYVAARRHCIGGACRIPRHSGVLHAVSTWGPAAGLTTAAFLLGRGLPDWVWMWLLALALFFGGKWASLRQIGNRRAKMERRRLPAYLFLWPGMDARAFFKRAKAAKPASTEWLTAVTKTLLGASLLWTGTGLVGAGHSLVRGWVGMLGIVFLLHFGFFHLLSLCWRALGIDARPIMNWPAAATSLSEFWGRRWNAAFADLAHDPIFKPIARTAGGSVALLTVFLVSGAVHELVISVPARCGYGLPMLYFVLQGIGVLLEHSGIGRALGFGTGRTGWIFTALVAGAPAFWLFHPGFINNVILPMLRALGAA